MSIWVFPCSHTLVHRLWFQPRLFSESPANEVAAGALKFMWQVHMWVTGCLFRHTLVRWMVIVSLRGCPRVLWTRQWDARLCVECGCGSPSGTKKRHSLLGCPLCVCGSWRVGESQTEAGTQSALGGVCSHVLAGTSWGSVPYKLQGHPPPPPVPVFLLLLLSLWAPVVQQPDKQAFQVCLWISVWSCFHRLCFPPWMAQSVGEKGWGEESPLAEGICVRCAGENKKAHVCLLTGKHPPSLTYKPHSHVQAIAISMSRWQYFS